MTTPTDPTAALKLARDALAWLHDMAAGGKTVDHLYDGDCPDALDRTRRDPACPACMAMDRAADAIAAIDALPAPSGEPAVPLAAELQKIAAVADADGDDYTPALNLRAPEPPTPIRLARNHSAESAWRVGWMRGWMAARSTAAPALLVDRACVTTGVVDHETRNLSATAQAAPAPQPGGAGHTKE